MSSLDYFDPSSGVGGSSDPPVWNPWENQSMSQGLIYPDIDMSTALQTSSVQVSRNDDPIAKPYIEENVITKNQKSSERVDLAPKLYACCVKTAILPCRLVQNDLVSLYFRHVHPLFPVVDEHHFSTVHRRFRGQEELMNQGDFLIYLSILAAGFAHLTEIQLQRTPYRSIHDGQGALYDQVKARYWAATMIDPVVLTQVALIITLWSPGPPAPTEENNSYWLDIAFKHAYTFKLWDFRKFEAPKFARCRVLWWCCVVRDRHLALILRRPHRLHNITINVDLPSESDFGLEATEPSFVELPSKRLAMLSFTWLCKLSEIMARIANFQRQFRFSLEWNGTVDSYSGFQEVSKLDQQLDQWRGAFENSVSGGSDARKVSFSPPVTLLRIISYSTVTILYQFYFLLHRRDIETGSDLKPDPLERIKECSYYVAKNLEVVKSKDGIDDIPLWTLGCFVLPFTVYQVSEQIEESLPLKELLTFFIKKLTRRSSGAHTISQTVVRLVKAVVDDVNDSYLEDTSGLSSDTKMGDTTSNCSRPVMGSTRWQREARILAIALSLLDSSLEHNSIPDQSRIAVTT
ncbi:hypothetical protein IFR05_001734 [Cadophora sp. M221]|nr:hypothetical protein IFR05_001734 [Cadophora sp. M221]